MKVIKTKRNWTIPHPVSSTSNHRRNCPGSWLLVSWLSLLWSHELSFVPNSNPFLIAVADILGEPHQPRSITWPSAQKNSQNKVFNICIYDTFIVLKSLNRRQFEDCKGIRNRLSNVPEVNFTEFAIKFAKICTVRAESPLTIRGMSSVRFRKMRNVLKLASTLDIANTFLGHWLHKHGFYGTCIWWQTTHFANQCLDPGYNEVVNWLYFVWTWNILKIQRTYLYTFRFPS